MHIVIKVSENPIKLEVNPEMSIFEVKNGIALETGIMCNKQKLILGGKLIEDNMKNPI